MTALAMLLALGLEAAFGWPQSVHQRIGHPVTWIGRLVATLDRRLNRAGAATRTRRALGAGAVMLTVSAAAGAGALLTWVLPESPLGMVLTAILAAPLFASRSLWDHVAAVARPLAAGDLPGARHEVAKIVGRDPETLDGPGIARASLESLAENSSDGVIAPLFWAVLLGLPGLYAYKAINTLDSMIGYRTTRHEAFGWAAARLDDVVNWIPARATALAFALASGSPRRSLSGTLRDARHHRSPNAGWPEAALAYGLDIRLSGPRSYGAGVEDHPWVNPRGDDPDASAIGRALRLYARMIVLCAIVSLPLTLF